jgi:hypothetical protein
VARGDPPKYAAALAVVSDYGDTWLRRQLRTSWYGAGGHRGALEAKVPVRVVFVIGRNPVVVEDGTGVVADTEEVKREADEFGDVLRVRAIHTPGNDGRSALIHDLWRAFAATEDAHFYVKAQARTRLEPRLCIAAS